MTAAGFPWLFVAFWFYVCLPNPLELDKALLASRFAAPTSAGVLFCMLEAAGLKETWLFKKARILAIFDDLDTILLMIPLKAVIIGMKWELFVVLAVLVGLVVLGYWKLHAFKIYKTWKWTMLYAFLITLLTELVYYLTKNHIEMEAVHLEVLMPAFVIGAIAKEEEHEQGHHTWGTDAEVQSSATNHEREEQINTIISAVFMVLVGLSMPSLFKKDEEETEEDPMKPAAYVFHVFMVSVLMVLGKMFPVVCYRQEADLRTRFALALGMCPRGEVGAGVIVISLALDVKGDAVPIAIISLALNIAMSGGFIFAVTKLVSKTKSDGSVRWRLPRRRTHLLGMKRKRTDLKIQPPPRNVEPAVLVASTAKVSDTAIMDVTPEPESPKQADAVEHAKDKPNPQDSGEGVASEEKEQEIEQIPGFVSEAVEVT